MSPNLLIAFFEMVSPNLLKAFLKWMSINFNICYRIYSFQKLHIFFNGMQMLHSHYLLSYFVIFMSCDSVFVYSQGEVI